MIIISQIENSFMDNYQKILNEALKIVKPSKEDEEKLKELSRKIVAFADIEIEKYGAEAMSAGSVTRNTWLPDKKECDVFLVFPKSLPEKELEDIGISVGRAVIKRLKGTSWVEYAQHPYVTGEIDGMQVDIVPCYAVESTKEIKSAVDRTPFHVRYLDKNLPQSLSDEVRLLKQLCKAGGVYGADARAQGLSGYACEVLVINYGKFMNVLKNIADWKPGEIIDTEKYYDKKDYKSLNHKFRGEALVLIDPTDKNRNVASAVSPENFFKLIKVVKAFLKEPAKSFFIKKNVKPLTTAELTSYLEKRNTGLLVVKMDPPKVVPDILWPQLRKFADRIESILEETKNEFKVLRKDVYTNDKDIAVVLLEMEFYENLPNVQKRIGPSVFDVDDAKRFIEKYMKGDIINGPFIEDDKWVVEIERRFLNARDKLVDSLKKDINTLKAKGIPNYIAEQMMKGFRIYSDADSISKALMANEDFCIFLRTYFEKENLA